MRQTLRESEAYGHDSRDAIGGPWGELAYEDLKAIFAYVKDNLSYVDTDRAVAIDCGYGGYMVNWIQGHEFGRRFKTLVTDNGIFSVITQLAASDTTIQGLHHDLNGLSWEDPNEWQKWDPAQYASHWQTLHSIINHKRNVQQSSAQGLAVFHTLQFRGVESAFSYISR